jgi:hypothetical protein
MHLKHTKYFNIKVCQITVFSLAVFCFLHIQAQELQPFQKRVFFNAPLEPKDQVINGAGQFHIRSFLAYKDAVGDSLKPLIYMDYKGLKSMDNNFPLERWLKVKQDINWYIALQIGLSMTTDGKPEERYEHLVALGDYDERIDSLISIFKQLNMPIYLRIGYEFNGHWNGYKADDYKIAYRRIVDKIRKAGVKNIANVWCFAPDGTDRDFMRFYPGDKYVDWWAIDLFSEKHFTDTITTQFMDSALAHKKPVMIGESAPRKVSTTLGEECWKRWFVPYFNFIRKYPHCKAFSYINWDWANTAWSDWGNSQIQANEFVRSSFKKELKQPFYLHSVSSKDAKLKLGIKP